MKKSALICPKRIQGFTLVELLVVIAIVGILAAVVVLIINPLELTKRSRDSVRLTDLQNLQQAINVALQESTQSSGVLCNGDTGQCSGNSSTGTRTANGTGWVRVNLSTQKSVSVPTLPVDPLNDATYFYRYSTNTDGDAWEIDANMESDQYISKEANTADGGNNDARYEVGSDLTILN